MRTCAWEALKALYFRKGTTDQACIDRLAAWSHEHGFGISMEEERYSAPGIPNGIRYKVHFKPPAATPPAGE